MKGKHLSARVANTYITLVIEATRKQRMIFSLSWKWVNATIIKRFAGWRLIELRSQFQYKKFF